MPLPKIMQDRIEQDAEKFSYMGIFNSKPLRNDDKLTGYIAGATAEHELAQKLADVLKEFITGHECGTLPNRFTYLKAVEVWQEWMGVQPITPDQVATLLHPPDDNSPKGMELPAVDPFTVKKEVGDG